MTRSVPRAVGMLVLSVLTCRCTARISGSDDAPALANVAGTAGGNGATASAGETASTAPRVMRRLSRFEYDNTVRDLLGQEANASREFPAEETSLGFDNNAEALMFPSALADQAFSKAEALALKAVADKSRFAPCAALDTSEACAREFIANFGLRALRRPVDEADATRYIALFRSAADFERGLWLVASSMLVSLPFFYRVETGDDQSAFVTASRLSYAVWGSMPDTGLLESARAGRLASKADVEREARRLIEDERAHGSVARFHALWLGLDGIGTANKDPELYPGYASQLLPALRKSVDLFLDQAAFRGAGFSDLMLGQYAYADERLAGYYGYVRAPEPDASALSLMQLPVQQSAGVLGQPGVLAMLAGFQSTSPTRRGAFVRTRLLCDSPAPPPPDVDLTPPPPSTTGSRRAQTAEHAAAPACRACHDLLDPIGFGFESYDATGRYRTLENGADVDARGVVANSPIGEFAGLPELARKLSLDPQARRCFATQWLRFVAGRKEQASDVAIIDLAVAALDAEQPRGYRELLLTLVTSEALTPSDALP